MIEVPKSHLHRDYLEEKDKAARILDDLEGELAADLAATSRQLVSMHAELHLSAFTDELSTRRVWLISHQPTTTEAISMKPDSRGQDALGNLLPEMHSNDGSALASEDESKKWPTSNQRSQLANERRNESTQVINNPTP